MHKTIGRALSGTLFYLCHGGVFIKLIGSERLRPLCYKLFQASLVVGGRSKGARRPNASSEDEGLGAAYDKRKWMEVYYGKSDV